MCKYCTKRLQFKTNTKFLLLQIELYPRAEKCLRPIQNFYCCRYSTSWLLIDCLRPIQNFYCCRLSVILQFFAFKTNTKFLLLQIASAFACFWGLRPIQNFYCCRLLTGLLFLKCLRPIQNFYCCRLDVMSIQRAFKTNTKFLLLQIVSLCHR